MKIAAFTLSVILNHSKHISINYILNNIQNISAYLLKLRSL